MYIYISIIHNCLSVGKNILCNFGEVFSICHIFDHNYHSRLVIKGIVRFQFHAVRIIKLQNNVTIIYERSFERVSVSSKQYRAHGLLSSSLRHSVVHKIPQVDHLALRWSEMQNSNLCATFTKIYVNLTINLLIKIFHYKFA